MHLKNRSLFKYSKTLQKIDKNMHNRIIHAPRLLVEKTAWYFFTFIIFHSIKLYLWKAASPLSFCGTA